MLIPEPDARKMRAAQNKTKVLIVAAFLCGIAAVALLPQAIESGWLLLVQDDPGNKDRRPQRFLDDIARLPNVALAGESEDALGLIAKAALVVAANDASGWNGLILGRRVLALTDNFYQAGELAHRLRNPELLAPLTIELMRSPSFVDPASAERTLGWLIDAEFETSMPSEGAAPMNAAVASIGDVLVRGPHGGKASSSKETSPVEIRGLAG